MTMIEWAHKAHRAVAGCSRASEGCDHCYSAKDDGTRLAHQEFEAADGSAHCNGDLVSLVGRKGERQHHAYNGKVFLIPAQLRKALKLPRSRDGEQRRIFWNHRSDTFHERLTNEEIAAQFGVMAARPDITFLVLTKRARRMREWFEGSDGGDFVQETMAFDDDLFGKHLHRLGGRWEQPQYGDEGRVELAGYWDGFAFTWPLPNVWLGVSVETPAYYDRIEDLRNTPAAKRFLSLEPALAEYRDLPLGDIDWVILGAESGPGARHAPLEWVRSVRDQVLAARQTCSSCHGHGYITLAISTVHGPVYSQGPKCAACDGVGWHGPALFIKQFDVCEDCSGRMVIVEGHSGNKRLCACVTSGGQTGKVRKGCPAIDGRVWDEVPR